MMLAMRAIMRQQKPMMPVKPWKKEQMYKALFSVI